MRKILVPLKRVPDYQIKVKVAPDQKGIVTDGIKWIVNPFDEIAVEEAIRIKEKNADTEVVVVSAAPAGATEQLRTALAMGADRAILVLVEEVIDSYAAHQILAKIYEREQPALVIMGKQAIDSDANQTGQLLAARLGLPQATFASKLAIEADWRAANVTREVDGGLETIRITLPAVVTTDLRLNEPRYPSLPGIVKAKKKPLEEIKPADLGVSVDPRILILRMELPAKRKGGVKVSSVAELVQKLKDEAKVL